MLWVNLLFLFSNLEYFGILLKFVVTKENLRILSTQALALYYFPGKLRIQKCAECRKCKQLRQLKKTNFSLKLFFKLIFRLKVLRLWSSLDDWLMECRPLVWKKKLLGSQSNSLCAWCWDWRVEIKMSGGQSNFQEHNFTVISQC